MGMLSSVSTLTTQRGKKHAKLTGQMGNKYELTLPPTPSLGKTIKVVQCSQYTDHNNRWCIITPNYNGANLEIERGKGKIREL